MSGKVPRPRGIDFVINWSIGSWSEDRVLDAINSTPKYRAFRYGVSRAGQFTFEEFARYYMRLQQTTSLHGKRPDLIVFDANMLKNLTPDEIRLLNNLMDTPDNEADPLIRKALFGVEVEVSKWHVDKMVEYQQRKGSTTRIMGPTFTIKEEDLEPLIEWMKYFNKEILVVQTFYDQAYAIPLSRALELIKGKEKLKKKLRDIAKRQDSKTKKVTYFIPCLKYGTLFGRFDPPPTIKGEVLIDDRGQIWPIVRFENGKLNITADARQLLDEIAKGVMRPNMTKQNN